MVNSPQREALERLIEERREDYAGLSRLIGRNAAYIQQFIKRGVPRRLAEQDVQKLASYFGVSPASLGSAALTVDASEGDDRLVRVPRLDVGASAGGGAFNGDESPSGHFGFEERWLRRLGSGEVNRLRFIRVQGDSMVPTLANGDDILVDEADAAQRVRDGIYVLRVEEALMVKRLAPNPVDRTITIKSDNPAYPDWTGCDPSTLTIIGRVIWAARRVS
jgi:phage repressor protein C with HTH and peptisase S24 domain